MTKKILSVIIPAYNVANYIVECVDSLLAQIPAPNELIIINDGSTDNTQALVEERYGDEQRVRLITIPNGGLGQARDFGISLAQGEYIFCCDPDDVVCEGFYQELSQTIARYPELELFCFNSLMFEDGNPARVYPKVQHHQFGLLCAQNIFRGLLHSGAYTSATWNYVLKKEIIDRFKLKYITRLHEDHSFTVEAFMRCRIAFVSKHLYYRQRIRSGSLTNGGKPESFFRQRYDAFVCSYDKLVKLSHGLNEKAELRRLYLIHSFRLMIHLSLASGQKVPDYVMNAIYYFGKSLQPDGIVSWLLLRKPELYSHLLKIKQSLRKA